MEGSAGESTSHLRGVYRSNIAGDERLRDAVRSSDMGPEESLCFRRYSDGELVRAAFRPVA